MSGKTFLVRHAIVPSLDLGYKRSSPRSLGESPRQTRPILLFTFVLHSSSYVDIQLRVGMPLKIRQRTGGTQAKSGPRRESGPATQESRATASQTTAIKPRKPSGRTKNSSKEVLSGGNVAGTGSELSPGTAGPERMVPRRSPRAGLSATEVRSARSEGKRIVTLNKATSDVDEVQKDEQKKATSHADEVQKDSPTKATSDRKNGSDEVQQAIPCARAAVQGPKQRSVVPQKMKSRDSVSPRKKVTDVGVKPVTGATVAVNKPPPHPEVQENGTSCTTAPHAGRGVGIAQYFAKNGVSRPAGRSKKAPVKTSGSGSAEAMAGKAGGEKARHGPPKMKARRNSGNAAARACTEKVTDPVVGDVRSEGS